MTEEVGVGPWPGRAAGRPAVRPGAAAEGDRRNVVDRYRYWTLEAIVADLDTRRHDFHVAIENWQHDFNIGTIVRTANAFLAREVHIVGNRRWNRRGAMVTDRYQHVRHHPDVDLAGRVPARPGRRRCIGIDNLPGLAAARDRRAAAPGVPAVRPGGPRALRRRPRRRATAPSRSRSSARPARSTPRRPRRSPCTPGSASTPTWTCEMFLTKSQRMSVENCLRLFQPRLVSERRGRRPSPAAGLSRLPRTAGRDSVSVRELRDRTGLDSGYVSRLPTVREGLVCSEVDCGLAVAHG